MQHYENAAASSLYLVFFRQEICELAVGRLYPSRIVHTRQPPFTLYGQLKSVFIDFMENIFSHHIRSDGGRFYSPF